MKSEYVLIDANNENIDWDAITADILAWQIGIGEIIPKGVDDSGVEDSVDVLLLLARARLLVSDNPNSQELALKVGVPFVYVFKDKELEKVDQEIMDVWHVRDDNSDSDLEHVGNVHI